MSSLGDLMRAMRERKTPAVLPHLERFLTLRRARRSVRPPDVAGPKWYPSALVRPEFCPRACMLGRRHGIDEFEVTNEKDRIFDVGHAMHRWYQERYLGPAGILWGVWTCSRCKGDVEGFMPKDSCPKCQWKEPGDLTPKVCIETCYRVARDVRGREDSLTEKRGGCVSCAKWGHWEYNEPRVEVPSHRVSCRLDGLMAEAPLGTPDIVWDLKTAAKERFGSIVVSGPPQTDKKQVTIYMWATGLRRAILTYVCKNDGRVHDVFFEYDEELIREEIADAALMTKCLAEGTLPERLDECRSSSSARANKCGLCQQCFQEV